MNPKYHGDTKARGELISKRLVIESLSPCAVPTLLSPRRMLACACVWIVVQLIRSPLSTNILSHDLRTCWMSFMALVCSIRWIRGVDITKSALERVMSGKRHSRQKWVCISGPWCHSVSPIPLTRSWGLWTKCLGLTLVSLWLSTLTFDL